MKSSVLTEF